LFGIALDNYNVELIPGYVQDTLNVKTPVLLAHVDVDWHDPVKISIERIWPMLNDKGVMIFDDYYSYSGCKKAVDDYFGSVKGITRDGSCGSMAILKK
jgi:asparagine synthase (glutamine-hydrolysing)